MVLDTQSIIKQTDSYINIEIIYVRLNKLLKSNAKTLALILIGPIA